jgi:hypothetical protein
VKKAQTALAASSEFARMAGQIGKDINSTTLKLQKLAQCASLSLALNCLAPRRAYADAISVSGQAEDAVR